MDIAKFHSDRAGILSDVDRVGVLAEPDRAERHQRVMQLHYRCVMADPLLRRIERVRSGPWCPAGSPNEVRMALDFSCWVEQHHENPTAVLALLFADQADDLMAAYADARAKADADALEAA
jgi:hypothetical protein